jgi:Zn-dependent M28 family amino/carboxypeptidase
MKYLHSLIVLSLFVMACNPSRTSETLPETAIDMATLARNIEILSSDEFEGRAPSSPGEEKTISFLEQQFKSVGLQPGNGNSYFQEVPLISITASPDMKLNVSSSSGSTSFSFGNEFVAVSPLTKEVVKLENSEIVYVGYGIVAPEFNWNDYEGLDVEGKTVLILVNDPGYATQDENLFTGNAMTYYGRWTYKYEEAARQGAAGAFIVHQTGPAGYPWGVVQNGWSGQQFYQAGREGTMPLCEVTGWISEDVARQWFKTAGLEASDMFSSATSADFKARSLGLRASVTLNNSIETSVSNNVIATIPGNTRPDEYIIYTAHWDHLGIDTTLEGNQIFNGAYDNATGVAGLIELAKAFMMAGQPERTVVFMPVTAEEQGLLGSAYYAENPIYPLEKTVATINIDGLNIFGPMNDLIIIGYGNSELDDYIKRAAEEQNRIVKPDPQPERGYYFRSDHFSFAKKGVPSMYTNFGIDHVEHGEEWTLQQLDEFTAEKYHKPADEYDPDWDLRGAINDLKLFFRIGQELANNNDWPKWNEGVPFKAIREN